MQRNVWMIPGSREYQAARRASGSKSANTCAYSLGTCVRVVVRVLARRERENDTWRVVDAREQVKEPRISFSGEFHERGRTGTQTRKDVTPEEQPEVCKVAVLSIPTSFLSSCAPSFLPSFVLLLPAVPRTIQRSW